MKIAKLASALLLAVLISPLTDHRAMGQDNGLSSQTSTAINTLSGYMVARVDLADYFLALHGYSPEIPNDTWRQFPSVRKIETAYLAAEAAEPNKGGDKLLALLASDLAQRYESIRHEPTLVNYFSQSQRGPLKFARQPALSSLPDLPPTVEAATNTLSEYCSKSAIGPPQFILTHYFGVSADVAYKLLRESNSSAEAFKRAATFVPEQERNPRLSTLTSDLAKRYEAIRFEPSLASFLTDVPPAAPVQAVPGSHPIVPQRPIGVASAEARYPGFVTENYTNAGRSMEFDVMSVDVEGFGGIVFGNKVSADPNMSHIQGISFDDGTISYHLADSSVITLRAVSAEDAYAAYHMVFSSAGVVAPQPIGQGIGLLSLDLGGTGSSITCNLRTLKVSESRKFNLVMHPALANLDLGWAAAMVDTLPIEPDLIYHTVLKAGHGQDEADAVKNLFVSMHTADFVDNWKLVDVPLMVTRDGESMFVRRSDDESFPEGLKRTAFIEMRAMKEEHYNKTFAEDFYQYVPLLTSSSTDYARLNEFAAVLAVVRLARAEGARVLSVPSPPQEVITPDAIEVMGTAIRPVAGFTAAKDLQAAKRKVDACLEEAFNAFPNLMPAADHLIDLYDQRDQAEQTAKNLSGTAQQRAKQDLATLDQMIHQATHEFESLPGSEYVSKLIVTGDDIDDQIDSNTGRSLDTLDDLFSSH